MTYKKYLFSRHWRRFRMKLRRGIDYCEICGAELCYGWEVHHWNYKNIPKERREDVSVLCPACHRDVHLWLDDHAPKLIRSTHIYSITSSVGAFLCMNELNEEAFVSDVERKLRESKSTQ